MTGKLSIENKMHIRTVCEQGFGA